MRNLTGICFVCEKDQAVKDNMCDLCYCYRFGLSAMEYESRRQKASKFEKAFTITLLALAVTVVIAISVWRMTQ